MFLLIAGVAAGFVDAVIGGGGVISLPALMVRLGMTPTAIGTNKAAGTLCTLTAVVVYGMDRRIRWRTALEFAGWVGVGALVGSFVGPRYLAWAYPGLLVLGTCGCLATLFFRRDLEGS